MCILKQLEHGVMGSNPARGTTYVRVFLCCPVLSRERAVGRSPFQGIQLKCLKEFLISQIIYEAEQATGPNQRNAQACNIHNIKNQCDHNSFSVTVEGCQKKLPCECGFDPKHIQKKNDTTTGKVTR